MRATALAAVLTAAAAAAAPARAAPLALDVAERTLENGLRVLVLEDRSIPNVALYVWWRVGSRDERTGVTGLAHFFEHMMFVGGERYGPEFDTRMEAAGGANNAWTSQDVTVYQDWFPASALPLVLDMEADRMRGMRYRDGAVDTERDVVASEYRLAMEDPAERLSVALWSTAYMAHPYMWSVLGWLDDIRNWRQSDLEEFFARNYVPQNATIVVVGSVDPEEVFARVEERMGGIPRGPAPRPVHTREPEQRGERRFVLEDPNAALSQVVSAFHIPETGHPDVAVLEVLERLLYGDSGRLHRLLVEDLGLALEVGGGSQGPQFDPSLFLVDLTLREGVEPGFAERMVDFELDRLRRAGPDARELEKAKNAHRADFVRRLRTIDGKAELIGETETFFGGWRNLGARVAAVDAVTAEDVQRVLATYFVARNRTVGTLLATGGDGPEDVR